MVRRWFGWQCELDTRMVVGSKRQRTARRAPRFAKKSSAQPLAFPEQGTVLATRPQVVPRVMFPQMSPSAGLD